MSYFPGLLAASDSTEIVTALIVATGSVGVGILQFRSTRSTATQTLPESLRERRRDSVEDEQVLTVAKLTAHSAPPIESMGEKEWRHRQFGWLAATVLLAAATVGLYWLVMASTDEDVSTLLFFTLYAFAAQYWAFGAYRRFKTIRGTTAAEAGSFEQTVNVHGSLAAANARVEDVISQTKLAVSSIERDDSVTTFAGVPQTGTELLEITVTPEDDNCVAISVCSSSTPAANSYRRNSRNVLQFIEKLAGVRVFQRRGNDAWVPPKTGAISIPEADSAETVRTGPE